jgi:hypothetical protein
MSRNISMEDILFGIGAGRAQSVGNMEVIPLISEDRDEIIDESMYGTPADVEIGTRSYGDVDMRNTSERVTFVPPGAGWVVKEAAQDHAIGSGEILGPKASNLVKTARCIQSNQSGTISKAAHEMLVLPVELRGIALAKRKINGYSEIWDDLANFNFSHGIQRVQALVVFLREFKRQMDQFVAEFELVPNQIGAVIIINGKVIGIEIAPTRDYWQYVWTPLIRVCYGSLASECYKRSVDHRNIPISNREPLELIENTLSGLRDAVLKTDQNRIDAVNVLVSSLKKKKFLVGNVEQNRSDHYLLSGLMRSDRENGQIEGQIVVTEKTIPFFSACGV